MSILLLTLFVALVATSSAVVSTHDSIVMDRFAEWMAKHDIRSKDESHLAHIFSNWVDNDKYIEYVNAQNLSYTLGHNAYSGMNLEEFGELMGFKANSDSIAKGLRGNAFEGVDRVHKLSGRYTLSKYFNMNLYDTFTDKIIVCKKNPSQFGPNVNVPWQHCSRLWSWPAMYHDKIVEFYKTAIDEFTNRVKVGRYADIEHMLYMFLPKELIHEVDLIGVWGSLGQNGRFVSN